MKHDLRSRFLVLLVAVAAAPPIAAQEYDPVPGGDILARLRSPFFLAATENTASSESIAGDALNPAISGAKQRVHIDAGYSALVGGGAWDGHAAAAGVSVPTPAGVFTGSVNYAGAEYEALDIGRRGSLNVSFSKELYPQLLFGAGLRGHLAAAGNSTDFGGGLDLGVVHILGATGPLPDVRWGAALTQLGVGANPVSGTSGSPAPFSLAADIQATLVDSDSIRSVLHTGFTVPSFQNVRYRVGSSTTILDRVSLQIGWDIDLRAQTESAREPDSLLPSVGLSVTFQTNIQTDESADEPAAWNRSDVSVRSAYAPLYEDVWAAGGGLNVALGVVDRDPPEIAIEYPEVEYLSPNNDGAADELLLPVTITDERFVNSWTLEVTGPGGEAVRRIGNKEQRPQNVGFQNVINRLLYVEQGVEIPEAIRWDGRTDEGGVAPDGTYTFTVRAEDDNGNTRELDRREIVVDATAPSAEIPEPEDPDALVFSPNDDGFKDVLPLNVSTSNERVWTLQILETGDRVVYEEERTDAAVESFTWDGRNDQGALVPDGVYSFRVASQDRALNEGGARLNNIIVNTAPTPIGLSVDSGFVSPNGDGRRDVVTVTPSIPITQGIRSHVFTVLDEDDDVVARDEGAGAPPDDWRFDGRNDAGERLPEGQYRIELGLVYRNGNRPTASAPPIVLDVTPPRLAVAADTAVFSPNGDGRLDVVTFTHETESIPQWIGTIRSAEGEEVRRYEWSGRPEDRLVWDGRTPDGERAPDGTYRYTLFGEDRAGNQGESRTVAVDLDTRETPVFVSPAREAFSPNGDGSADSLDLIPEIADATGIERFEMELIATDGDVVGRITDSGRPEDRYTWDGRGLDGAVVPDGRYQARLTVEYRHGNLPTAVSAPFRVDTQAPEAEVAAQASIFSPDGDGEGDTIVIEQDSSPEARWTAEIVAVEQNEVVRATQFSGEVSRFVWDGTSDDGDIVQDGRYRYRLTSIDEAGNRFTTSSDVFRIDTREVEVQLRVSSTAFSPNGDGVKETVELQPTVNIESPIESWTVSMVSDEGTTVWERSFRGSLQPVTWPGEGQDGTAPDGTYRGRLNVAFARGDQVNVTGARRVVLDTQAPTAEVSLSSQIISPNGDGNLDELRIRQDTSEEQRWVAVITTAEEREVGRWEWVGTAPERLVFSGLDEDRRRVADGTYRYSLSATDAAGNTTEVSPPPFEIYTAETPLELYATAGAFSPNDDGTLDRLDFRAVAGDARGLERWELVIEDLTGDVVFTREGDSLPDRLQWNGERTDGQIAAEGAYVARMLLEYRHGNRPTAQSEEFVLDNTAPEIEVETRYTTFSPDGDERRDSLRFEQNADAADAWRARIRNDEGTVVREFSWTPEAESFTWNGADEAGNVLPDGIYRYEIRGQDAAGNVATASIDEIEIDTRPARLFVTVDRRTVSPNGDGRDDQLEIGTITSRQDGATRRTVEIVDAAGRSVRSFTSESVESRGTIEWDGRNEAGRVVDGEYTVQFTVAYDNGALPQTVSPLITVDTQGPELTVDLRGLPFSPDNDGVNDELGIGLSVQDASDIAGWTFQILDRNERPYQRFEGTGRPRSELIWDGRSSDGETVISAEDYPYRFTAVDATGNENSVTGTIPVGILVVRDGDLLKIQISNINFAPNSPQLELAPDSEAGAKNIAVLDRLVEVFDRYRNYEIRVEGHAVNISGTEREQREELIPLSTARAETVREALIERGMDADRISIVGRGGSDPIVPHTDLENRWKNRRVEFILIR